MQVIADDIRYKKGWQVRVTANEHGMAYLQWSFVAPDYTAPHNPPKLWTSRKWYLSEHACESEIVQTALAAALMAEEHEAREAFTYMGRTVFNPHIHIDAMMEACQTLESRA